MSTPIDPTHEKAPNTTRHMATRLKVFFDTLGITAQEFEKQCNMNNGQAAKIMTGKMGVTYEKLSGVFIAYPQLNANWLITGAGQMLNHEADNKFRLKPGDKPARILAETIENLGLDKYVYDKCMTCILAMEAENQKAQKDLVQQHHDYVALSKALISANAAILRSNKTGK